MNFRKITDTVKYQYRFEGMAEKDGHLYKKFTKVSRFRSRHKRIFLYLIISVVAVPLAYLVITRYLAMLNSNSSDAAQTSIPTNW